MSVIACKVHDDRIQVCADSIRVQGWAQRTDGKLTKLSRVRDVVVGGSGYSSENGLMQIFLATHRPERPDVPSVLALLGEFAEWKNKRTGSSSLDNHFILAFDGHAFITNGYYVDEIHNFDAVGAGFEIANAAMHLGHDAYKAVEVACDLSIFCERPILTEEVDR